MKKAEGHRSGSGSGSGSFRQSSAGDYHCFNHDQQRHDDNDDDDGNNGSSRSGAAAARNKNSPPVVAELRLNVFREVLWTGWFSPQRPRYYEARPSHFPPEITAFLTGGLYSYIGLQAAADFLPLYHRVHWLTVFAIFITCAVVTWYDPYRVEEWVAVSTDPTEARFWIQCLVLYTIKNFVAYVLTRPAMIQFHKNVDAVARELSPVFRRVAGYDVQYCPSSWSGCCSNSNNDASCGSCILSCFYNESFVRLTPRTDALTVEELEKADAMWDPSPSRCSNEVNIPGFRVAVYGRQANTDQMEYGDELELNFTTPRALRSAQGRVDLFTWGCVATELRPCTDRYQSVRFWMRVATVLAWSVPLGFKIVPLYDDSWWPTIATIGAAIVFFFLCYPTWLETWCYGRRLLDQMRDTVQRLSPVVEERSGYRLWLELEREGCLGGTAAYVRFEGPPAASFGHDHRGGRRHAQRPSSDNRRPTRPDATGNGMV